MAQSFDTLKAILSHGFDTVIDVRSPAEFAEDHIPGAINLPALSNEERAEVGTMYKQVSPFRARKLGASLVLNNISAHVEGPLKDHDGGWRPLIYCWRGGQRSGVFTTILKEIGWRADVIRGGYQTYRRLVTAELYDAPLPHQIVLLDGYTGTAKTALLPYLQDQGVQILDLEGLADHRGSLLGALPCGQPSQKMFETRLAQAISKLDPNKPTIVEAESSKVGKINLPPALWSKMIEAPRVSLVANIDARAGFLTSAYDDILRDPATVRDRLAPLRRVRGHAVVDRWQALQDAGDLTGLARALVTDHYDPAYDKSRSEKSVRQLATVTLNSMDEPGLIDAATKIVQSLNVV